MTSKRDLVLKAFRGEEVERVPIAFWYHFAKEEDFLKGFNNPEIFETNLTGHQQFIQGVQPDLIKIMSDGFFAYPNPVLKEGIKTVKDLEGIEPLGADHPWYDQQVDLVKQVRASFIEEIVSVYNIFAPATHLKWQLAGKVSDGDAILATLIQEDPEAVRRVLEVIAADIAVLAQKVVTEGGADGIYYSTQSVQVDGISSEDYRRVIRSSDLLVLDAVNQVSQANILHICGYKGAKNDLELFTDYPVQVINWAVGPEGVSLAEGRDLFGDKTVLGGFENTDQGLLYQGSQEAIQAEALRLVQENGKRGLIVGADCTIPSDIANERIEWVRQALKQA